MWLSSSFSMFLIRIVIGSILFLAIRKGCNILYGLITRITNKVFDLSGIMEIENEYQCALACQYLRSHCKNFSALGFDCEWVSVNGMQRPVALLQLASSKGLCCLFRLNKLGSIPTELKNLLNDQFIVKTGVCPLDDSKLLLRDYNTQVLSTLDLRFLYPKFLGLGSLANSVLGVQLDKSWQLRCSDWESPKLTEAQKDYAAKDALVAIEIFKKWISNFCNNANFTPHELNNLYDVRRYLDVRFTPKLTHLLQSNEKIVPEGLNIYNTKKEKAGYAVRKSPLYDNCFMVAPDGELLCSCDRRKAQWYVDKGLAEVLPGEPYTIKLLFEPAARADESSNGEFYRQLKQNCCVVCGASESYLKHNVVPKEYRKHFPAAMKDHQSHDIVLMCVKCHYLANQHNENLRRKLAFLCDAPIQKGMVIENSAIRKVKNAAKALIVDGKTIPVKRRLELENEIKQYYQVDMLHSNILHQAVNLEANSPKSNIDPHGLRVVNYFKTSRGGLKNLELLWRKYFLKTMKPKYLPTFWSPTHNHSRQTFQ